MLTHPVAHYRCRRGSVGSHPNRLPRQSLHPAMHCIHRHNASAARSRTGPCIKVIAHWVDGCLRTNPTAAHCMPIAAREMLQIFDVIRVKRTAPRYASHSARSPRHNALRRPSNPSQQRVRRSQSNRAFQQKQSH